jgi:REP element-mobilizing transposase RayT
MPEISPAFHRHSIRLKDYDYASPGAYFVTVVTKRRDCILGEVENGEMRLNEFGLIVDRSWKYMAERFPYIYQDTYIAMPNHFHGILEIIEMNDLCRGGSRPAPTVEIKPSGQLIGIFKTISAKQINLSRGTPGSPVWQRNYYEHIIRNPDDMDEIYHYILANPSRWEDDPEKILPEKDPLHDLDPHTPD